MCNNVDVESILNEMYRHKERPKNEDIEIKGEVTLLGRKRFYISDNERDYFHDISENTIKVHMSFSKNPEDNKKAEEALKTFFTELYFPSF